MTVCQINPFRDVNPSSSSSPSELPGDTVLNLDRMVDIGSNLNAGDGSDDHDDNQIHSSREGDYDNYDSFPENDDAVQDFDDIKNPQAFGTPNGYSLELNAEPNTEKRYFCKYPGCNSRPYRRRSNMEAHFNTHEGVFFRCRFCENSFRRKSDRHRHEDIKHRQKRWKCNHCSKMLSRKPTDRQQSGCMNTGDNHAYMIVFLDSNMRHM
ncbi:hypothetical protein EC991_007591 [Linnemannia zychae]|nr:hypothetical protein EC991_007591 [Linnemannia zychae]